MEPGLSAIIALITIRAVVTGTLVGILYMTGWDVYSYRTTKDAKYLDRIGKKMLLVFLMLLATMVFGINWGILILNLSAMVLTHSFLTFGKPRLAAFKQRRLEKRLAKDQLTDLRTRKRILLESQQKLRIEGDRVEQELETVDEALRSEPGGPYRA